MAKNTIRIPTFDASSCALAKKVKKQSHSCCAPPLVSYVRECWNAAIAFTTKT